VSQTDTVGQDKGGVEEGLEVDGGFSSEGETMKNEEQEEGDGEWKEKKGGAETKEQRAGEGELGLLGLEVSAGDGAATIVGGSEHEDEAHAGRKEGLVSVASFVLGEPFEVCFPSPDLGFGSMTTMMGDFLHEAPPVRRLSFPFPSLPFPLLRFHSFLELGISLADDRSTSALALLA
jgi:hypothetical protein